MRLFEDARGANFRRLKCRHRDTFSTADTLAAALLDQVS
jgi:hypothetical protein